ncbi:hypothetical protein IW261DRAFT_1425262 [Armillaria novae-zelandiae]|uniref:Uncharacterized protein n=1 Tax=Armillaria novae-zelandiae TaxID=153914 RepID=A0AA39NT28_9AGAR|nr:hypothetical protein IW261DRAFT_1425262 [Armillaria novae-zelandiae]
MYSNLPPTPSRSSPANLDRWEASEDLQPTLPTLSSMSGWSSDYVTPTRPSHPTNTPFWVNSPLQPAPDTPAPPAVTPPSDDVFAFGPSPVKRQQLHLFAELGNIQGGLSLPDMLTHLFSLTVQFNLHNKCFEGDQNAETMAGLLQDLKSQLVKGFDFTKAQKDNIRFLGRDILYDPQRTAYRDIEDEIFQSQRCLLREKDTLGFKNVFGIPSREHLLCSEV